MTQANQFKLTLKMFIADFVTLDGVDSTGTRGSKVWRGKCELGYMSEEF